MGDFGRFFSSSWHRSVWRSIGSDALFRRILKNTSFLFSSSVAASGLGFVQSVVVARVLGVGGYGFWALLTTYVMVVQLVVDFRVWETVTKYLSEFMVKGDTARAMATVKLAYAVDFLTGILSFGIAVAAAPVAGCIFGREDFAGYAWIVALSSLVATVNGSSTAILRVFNRFKWISFWEVARSVVSLALVGAVALMGYGLKGIAVAYVLTSSFSALLLTTVSFSTVGARLPGTLKTGSISLLKDRTVEIASFLMHTNISAFWPLITRNTDVLILGMFRGSTEVGFLQLAKNFVFVIAKFQEPLYYSIFPEISKLWAEGDVKRFKSFLKRLTFMTASAFIPLGLGVFFLADPMIRLFYGDEFGPAVTALRIMVWGVIASCIFVWLRPTIIGMGKPKAGTVVGGIGAAVYLAASFILVPRWGYLGSAAVNLIPSALGIFLLIVYISRKTALSGESRPK
ncbi:MAG: flippase [Candidatus Latescibacteria bacterium]|nr:flippase [Candidatus Latescibacterota bacterium]